MKKLDFFAGTWKGEGTISPGPWGTGGKYSITHKNEWMDGNFFLINHSESKMPPGLGGESSSFGFGGYDADKKVSFLTECDSQGGRGVTECSLNGDT